MKPVAPSPYAKKSLAAEKTRSVGRIPGREDAVGGTDPEHLLGVGLATHHHVVVQVDRALGKARRAGRVLPVRRVIARGRRGREARRGLADAVLEGQVGAGGAAGDEHVLEVPGLGERGRRLGEQRRRDDGDLGAAVVQEVEIVGGAHQRVGGDRHRPDLDGAPERSDELGRVEAEHEHAVLGLDADLQERVPGAVHQLLDLPVGERPALIVERRRGAASLGDVPVDEPRRHVELRGERLRRDHVRSGGRTRSRSAGC